MSSRFRLAENGEVVGAARGLPERPPEAQIGSLVRSLRKARGWTMRSLADRADVSQPFISKLEAGQILPSITTLYALAAAFEISASALLPARERPASPVTADRVHYPLSEEPGASSVGMPPAAGDGPLQLFEFHLNPGEGDSRFFEHGGAELVHVTAGQVTSHVHGAEERLLGAGQSLQIDPSSPHRWVAGPSGATFIMVCAD